MLITFTSKAYPDVVMFGDIATVLLRAMGQSDEPPGILRGADIRLAAERLRAWLELRPQAPPFVEDTDRIQSEEQLREARNRVSLRTRAQPLLELLDASYKKEADVIWR